VDEHGGAVLIDNVGGVASCGNGTAWIVNHLSRGRQSEAGGLQTSGLGSVTLFKDDRETGELHYKIKPDDSRRREGYL